MHLEGYDILAASDGRTYRFTNTGEQGTFQMVVDYSPINTTVYNLAFGAVSLRIEDGQAKLDLDDTVVINNGNRDEVMATVAHTMLLFWEKYPLASIFITGSTPARTRLYRGILNKFGDQLRGHAIIYGVKDQKKHPFRLNVDYDGFILEP